MLCETFRLASPTAQGFWSINEEDEQFVLRDLFDISKVRWLQKPVRNKMSRLVLTPYSKPSSALSSIGKYAESGLF